MQSFSSEPHVVQSSMALNLVLCSKPKRFARTTPMLDNEASHALPFASSSLELSQVFLPRPYQLVKKPAQGSLCSDPWTGEALCSCHVLASWPFFGKTFDCESHPDMLKPPQMSETKFVIWIRSIFEHLAHHQQQPLTT